MTKQLKHIGYIFSSDLRCFPCPFCGKWNNENGISFDILFDLYCYKIRCLNCFATPFSVNSTTIEAAIHFWNIRNQLASLDDAKLLIRKLMNDLSKTIE
jgi:hypothetical protein